MGYQAQLGQFNADQASGSGMMGGLFSLGGSLLSGGTGSIGSQLGAKFLK
jgi:hypothetical protein